MLRIVAGRARGRLLATPNDLSVRPTSDRVREAVFNVLAARLSGGFDGLAVLDLFAGTGALGLEAWSRGAESVTFVEKDRKALTCLAGNLERLGLAAPVVQVVRGDALALVGRLAGQFDLVFVDPPYDAGLYAGVLAALSPGNLLAPGAFVVVEHRTGDAPVTPPGLELAFDRAWGDTTVKLLCTPEGGPR
jgi:16S rRNA (guanine966-N2)-methyltransferase